MTQFMPPETEIGLRLRSASWQLLASIKATRTAQEDMRALAIGGPAYAYMASGAGVPAFASSRTMWLPSSAQYARTAVPGWIAVPPKPASFC
jgi:hypothetical protein